MVITVTCPSCSSTFPVDSKKIPAGGVSARCSACRHVFRIEPAAEPVPPPPATPEPVWAPPPLPEPEPAWEPPAPSFEEPPPAFEPPTFEETSFEEPAAPEPTLEEEPPAFEPPAFEEPFFEPPAVEAPREGGERHVAEAELSVGAEAPVAGEPERDWIYEQEEQLDPGSLTIEPMEKAEPAALFVPAPPSPEPPPPPPPATPPAEPATPAVGSFTFGRRDPKDKARRLARVLVSDMIMYNPARHERALANGTLKEDFADEIAKSWKEYVDQVGEEMATHNPFWADALNDVLAKGQRVF